MRTFRTMRKNICDVTSQNTIAAPSRTALSLLLRRLFGSDSQRVVSSNCGVGVETIGALLEANSAVAAADPALAAVEDADILLALHFLRCYPHDRPGALHVAHEPQHLSRPPRRRPRTVGRHPPRGL